MQGLSAFEGGEPAMDSENLTTEFFQFVVQKCKADSTKSKRKLGVWLKTKKKKGKKNYGSRTQKLAMYHPQRTKWQV
jgi:hypothetical protein